MATRAGGSPLVERRFRANPDYELLLREQPGDGTSLPPSPAGEALYGYLRPRAGSRLPWRALSPDHALLFLTMQRDGPLPGYFRAGLGGRTHNRLMRLLLDGILEVEHEGSFVSGARTRTLLIGDAANAVKGHLAALSIEALRYAEALGDLTEAEIAGRLYGFGRRPVTATKRRQLLDCDRIAVGKYWTVAPSSNAHWVILRPSQQRADAERTRFKLYVSPALSHVAEACAASA